MWMLATLSACNNAPEQKAPPRPPVSVMVETASTMQVPVEVAVIGNVESISTIAVRSRIDGQIERVFFREGQDVRRGDPLFQIDARPYKVALEKAEADAARDRAQLRNADNEEKRYSALIQQKFVSPQEYDQRTTTLETLRATVQSDRSALDNAQLNLDYTKISAPVSGRAGSLQITAGNLVKANADPPLVIIRQLSPIRVTFAVPADRLSEIRRYAGSGIAPALRGGATKAAGLPVQAVPHGDSEAVPAHGELTFIDNGIDLATGTITLKATFANEDAALWPGQFVDVKLTLSSLPNATVVPARAVQTGQRGEQLFVVSDGMTAEARSVKTGIRNGEMIVIESGVTPGERVVVDGQVNLVTGAKVAIKTPPGPAPSAPRAEGARP
jgi:multidrug efflux system membrane fusion protein